MERRHDERDHRNLARSVEAMTGKSFPQDDQITFLNGRQEIDLVRSGLEEMMVQAFKQLSDHVNAGEPTQQTTLREAAYQITIGRVASAYSAIDL